MTQKEELGYGILAAMALFVSWLVMSKKANASPLPIGIVTTTRQIPFYGEFGPFEPVPGRGVMVSGTFPCPSGYGLWRRSTDKTYWCFPVIGPSGLQFEPIGVITVEV